MHLPAGRFCWVPDRPELSTARREDVAGMTVADSWIVIPKFFDYQHRDTMRANTAPPWLKLYTRLMDNQKFLDLTFAERGLLISLWIAYAKSDGRLSVDTTSIQPPYSGRTAKLTRRLGQRVLSTQLVSLNEAGFIAFAASRPPALCQQPASSLYA